MKQKIILIIFFLSLVLYGQSLSKNTVFGTKIKLRQSAINQNVIMGDMNYLTNLFSRVTKTNVDNYNNYLFYQSPKNKQERTITAGVLGFIAGGLVYEAILDFGEGKMNVSSEYPDAKVHDSGSVVHHIAGWVLVGGLGVLVCILIAS